MALAYKTATEKGYLLAALLNATLTHILYDRQSSFPLPKVKQR